TRERLSVIPLGHRTYLATKVKGENSMFGKAGRSETTKRYARRDPDGTVKATLPEPKCQYGKGRRLDKRDDSQALPEGQHLHIAGKRRSQHFRREHAPRELDCYPQSQGNEMGTDSSGVSGSC